MKSSHRAANAVVLALVICLSAVPASAAEPLHRDYEYEVRERVVRVIKKVRQFFGGITGLEDVPMPPRP